jgi:hypothetical protein
MREEASERLHFTCHTSFKAETFAVSSFMIKLIHKVKMMECLQVWLFRMSAVTLDDGSAAYNPLYERRTFELGGCRNGTKSAKLVVTLRNFDPWR